MIDFNLIKDDVYYNSKEVCNLIDITDLHYFIVLKKKHNLKPSLRNGKSWLYKGSDIKEFLNRRLTAFKNENNDNNDNN